MLEIIHHKTDVPFKQGRELPSVAPKIILGCTDTWTADIAIRTFDRDYFSHRPHYVIDPVALEIHKIADSTRAVIGTFAPSAPHTQSRCIFVSICKFSVIELDDKTSENVGWLLRVICDIEGVPAILYPSQPYEDEIGPATLNEAEGIVPWHCFPQTPEIQQPGSLKWELINKGLQDYDAPDRLGISGDGETEVYEIVKEDAVETATEDLDELKVAELKEIASELGISSYSSMKKTELIDAITTARS